MKAVGIGIGISFYLLFVASFVIGVGESSGIVPAIMCGIAVIGATFLVRWKYLRNRKPIAATHVCMHCHTRIVPDKITTRNGAVTFILFLLAIIPAFIYMAVSKDRLVCTKCGAGNPVPLDAPAAQALLAA